MKKIAQGNGNYVSGLACKLSKAQGYKADIWGRFRKTKRIYYF